MDGDGDGGGEGEGGDLARAAEALEELYVCDMFFPEIPEEKLVKLKALADAADVAAGDPLAGAAEAVEELYRVRDMFFPAKPEEKLVKLKALADVATGILDSVPADLRKSTTQRAHFEYLRGKVLDAFPDYIKEAEEHLSKAVKLNPSLADAWLCLGNCIWKKGDLSSAKNCFSLALSKGQDKRILCQLSMLERQLAQGTENEAQSVDKSIHYAKEAILLDVKDGNSWYNLGNAFLTSFFVTGAWDKNKLLQSLRAYQNAEKDEKMQSNPDLYFNCATVDRYLENYERALIGFEAAALKDPGLDASVEVQKIIDLLEKIEYCIKGQSKAKRLASLAASLNEVSLNTSHKKATISVLSEGLNKTSAIVGKVILFVKHDNVSPLYYIICDSEQTCFALSVYGLHGNAIKGGDRVTLLDPCYHKINFSWKGKCYRFSSVRVDFMEQILVNGRPPASQHAVRSYICAQHKP